MALQREERLKGVDEKLVKIVRLAALYAPFDILVVEGLRTQKRQAELVKAGASRTMNSKHLVGKAVDLAPIVNDELRWDWPLFFSIFSAMRKAAMDTKVGLRWGGVWDKLVDQYEDPEREVRLYTRRMADAGKRAFVDGPHFELA